MYLCVYAGMVFVGGLNSIWFPFRIDLKIEALKNQGQQLSAQSEHLFKMFDVFLG